MEEYTEMKGVRISPLQDQVLFTILFVDKFFFKFVKHFEV